MKCATVTALLAVSVMAQEFETGIGQTEQVTLGLVAYWSMRNSGATVFDEKGTNNGTTTNSPTLDRGNGVVGPGVYLNGTNQNISAAHAASLNAGTSQTVAFWMKCPAQTSKYVLSKYDFGNNQRGWGLTSSTPVGPDKMRILVSGDGTLGAGVYKDYLTQFAVFDDTWKHFAYTWSSGELLIYLNGALRTDVTKTADGAITAAHASTAGVRIGTALNNGVDSVPNFVSGSIDEIRIYNRSLAADEIKQLYRMGATIFQNR